MKKKQNPRTKSALILTFCLLFCWASAGITADHIQLRKYPSPDGPVSDTIPKGQKLKIIETFGSWRYILVEGSTHGGGWVHFEDLEKGPATSEKAEAPKGSSPKKRDKTVKNSSWQRRGTKKEKKNPKPSFHSKVSVGTVKIHPVAVHKEARETKPDKRLKKNPDPKNDPPDHALNNGNKAAKEDLPTAQAAIEKRVQPPHNIKPTPPRTERTEPKESFHGPEENTPMALIKTAYADSLPKTTVPADRVPNGPAQDPAIPGTLAKGPERSRTSTHADNTRDFPHEKKEAAGYRGLMRDFLNFVFRLLSVVLSCLAIIFAYKAKKMATMSYHLVVQLQQSIEIHRRREFDERY